MLSLLALAHRNYWLILRKSECQISVYGLDLYFSLGEEKSKRNRTSLDLLHWTPQGVFSKESFLRPGERYHVFCYFYHTEHPWFFERKGKRLKQMAKRGLSEISNEATSRILTLLQIFSGGAADVSQDTFLFSLR